MLFDLQYRSYFSRLTRERRTKANEKRKNSEMTVSSFVDDEDDQIQEEDDDSDFDSSQIASQANNLLGNAMGILNDMIEQQQQALDDTDC